MSLPGFLGLVSVINQPISGCSKGFCTRENGHILLEEDELAVLVLMDAEDEAVRLVLLNLGSKAGEALESLEML